ncbi:MAG: DMT family transporter [Ottowia sp.]|uniref:DMT family transporter n=1 Tax=Ottowia sp. TaxID=1898956 RepID=UPI0039E31C85
MPALVALEFILLAALWGASFMFLRMGALEFGPLPTAGLRVAIAALALLPVMLARGLWPQLRQHWKPVLFCGVINSAVPFALYSYALLHISTGLSAILNATVPLFGAVVAWAWLGDRLDASRALGLAIGFVGVALLAGGEAGFQPGASAAASFWGIAACLLATLSYGVSASYTRRYLNGLNSLMVATGSQIGAALGLALPTLLLWPAQMPRPQAWLGMLALGLLCTAVAYVLFFSLIQRLGPARAITVTFAIPVFAVFYGVTLLGETLTPWVLACGLVVLCGTALATGAVRLFGR